MLAKGTVLQGRYRVAAPLGQGGMAAVYRVWDLRLNAPLALKEMTPQPGLDAATLTQLRRQFEQEASVLANLSHPFLVDVTDYFEEGGNDYLVMKFVEGESLADCIERDGALPEDRVLEWADQLLAALDYCHRQGVIHRDIKPQNVIIHADGHAVLVDFGLVKLWDPDDPRTRTAMRGMGTPEYAPPEQYSTQASHTDPRSDIYGLGATLYHALTGQAPVEAVDRLAAVSPFPEVRDPNPRVSAKTNTAVSQAMELPVHGRFQSAAEMRAALQGDADTSQSGEAAPVVGPAAPSPKQATKLMPSTQAAGAPWWQRVPTWGWVVGASIGSAVAVLLCVGLALGASVGRPAAVAPAQPAATAAMDRPPATIAPTPTTKVPTEGVAAYSESPMLADMVASGDLPPVEDRLPVNPRVVQNLGGEPGVYGGELRVGFVGSSPEWGGLLFVAAWEHLVSWKPDFSGWEPNVAERVDVNDDATEYTFYLREGLKWSSGEPFDADDIMFYIDGVLLSPDLSPTGPAADWLPADMREGFSAEKIDQYTVKLIFPSPYGTFLYNVAGWSGRYFTMYPRHYLEQFHGDYNPDVDALVDADRDATDWMDLFFKYGPDTWTNPGRWYQYTELPSLYPWITTEPLDRGTQIQMERNPYYFKVDAQGNQLPYIDTLVGISYQDDESRTLAMLNGDLDFIKDPGDYYRVLYHDAVDTGKPLIIKYPQSDEANVNTIHFNQTVDDPIKAAVYANKDFRIGMSHAINREEVIEIIFGGQGTPAQHAPNTDSPYYIEGMDTQYVEYDVALANEYLDKVLPEKDAEGFRLDKNGDRFQVIFTVESDLSFGTYYIQLAELLIGYWEEVGVEVILNSQAGETFGNLQRQNEIEATIFTGEGGAGVTPLIDPRYYVPMEYYGFFALGWYGWRVPDPTGETVAVEPPQWAIDAHAKHDQAIAQPTQELQMEKMREVIQEANDRFYVIGIARPGIGYYPFHSRLGGIPDTWYDGWYEGVQKILYPEQWFLRE